MSFQEIDPRGAPFSGFSAGASPPGAVGSPADGGVGSPPEGGVGSPPAGGAGSPPAGGVGSPPPGGVGSCWAPARPAVTISAQRTSALVRKPDLLMLPSRTAQSVRGSNSAAISVPYAVIESILATISRAFSADQ